MAKLTDRVVHQLRPQRGQTGWREVSDDACRGLLIRLSPRGEKIWALRVMLKGKRTRQTIGAYPAVGLAEARKVAGELLAAAREGQDLVELQERKRAAQMTFREAHDEYLAAVGPKLSPRYLKEKRQKIERHVSPLLQARPIRDLSRADLANLSDDLQRKGVGPEVNLVINEVRACLRWYAERGLIDSVPILPRSARVKQMSRDRTLTDSEIKALWLALDDRPQHVADLFRLFLLTGARRGQVERLEWQHVDLEQRLWSAPPTHHKMGSRTGLTIVLPLADYSVALLERRRETTDGRFVFPAIRAGAGAYNGTPEVVKALRKAGVMTDWVVHDLRRTMRTTMRRLGIDEDVCEACLGHAPQGIVKVYDRYDRLEEKRDAFQRWADYVLGVVGERGDNVVMMRGRP
ncbi:MAG: tyrosine-type recombinase/integrase [Kiloniellales bacterium]